MTDIVTNIATEALRIEEDSLFSAKAHFEAARSWTMRHFMIGVPATILAAAATAVALANYKFLTACMAAAAAVLTALLTFLDPKQRATAHLNAGNAYKALNNSVRIFREVSIAQADPREAEKQLLAFNDERNRLNKESPQPPPGAYTKAKSMIEGGQTTYAADKSAR